MRGERTVEQKVADWYRAFDTIRRELTPEPFRAMIALTTPDGEAIADPAAIRLGIEMTKLVFANDRNAATVAAMLTTNAVKAPVTEEED